MENQLILYQEKPDTDVNYLIQEEMAEETRALLNDLRELESLTVKLAEVLQLSGQQITLIETNLDQTEFDSQKANYSLLGALSRRNFGASLKSIAALAALGGATGCYLGSTILTGGIVGAAGGAGLALGSTGLVGYYNHYKVKNLHETVNGSITEIVEEPTGMSDLALNPFLKSGYGDSETKDITTPNKQIWWNLRQATRCLEQTNQLLGNTHQELVIQGEALERSLATTSRIRALMSTGKILVNGLHQNFFLYFLKLLGTNKESQLFQEIQASLKVEPAKPEDQAGGLEIGTRYQRYGLPFVKWTDIKKESLFALQSFWSTYRIVAINPENQEEVKKIYRFTHQEVKGAQEIFTRIVSLIRLATCSLSTNSDIYRVLDTLPALDELHASQNPEDVFGPILDQMISTLRYQIGLNLQAMQREISRQEQIQKRLTENIEVSTERAKENNRKLTKVIKRDQHIFYGGTFR